MFTHKFKLDEQEIVVTCSDINCYAELEDMAITIEGDEDFENYDDDFIETIVELASEELYERKYNNEVRF